MFVIMRFFVRNMLVLTLAILGSTTCILSAEAQIQDQWKPVDKTLSDYVSEGFVLQSILLERVTPVSVQATQYFLRKENTLVRCTETTTRRSGTIIALVAKCAELGEPTNN